MENQRLSREKTSVTGTLVEGRHAKVHKDPPPPSSRRVCAFLMYSLLLILQ